MPTSAAPVAVRPIWALKAWFFVLPRLVCEEALDPLVAMALELSPAKIDAVLEVVDGLLLLAFTAPSVN